MKRFFAALVFIAIAFAWCHEKRADWRGIPAAQEPAQSTANLPRSFQHEDYTITPLATYSITAVVLGRERYRFDPVASLAPVDLALGWGPMSIAANINELHITQNGRFYEYSWSNEPPMEPSDIVRHSANTHCLPANSLIRSQLLKVKRHDLVTLEGYLVEVKGRDGGHWRSSLTREDSGGGACEVLWVTAVRASHL